MHVASMAESADAVCVFPSPFGWNPITHSDAIAAGLCRMGWWDGGGPLDGVVEVTPGGWRVRRDASGRSRLRVPDAEACVYLIAWDEVISLGRDTENMPCYIGKAKDLQSRMRQHVADALRGACARRVRDYLRRRRPPAIFWRATPLEWCATESDALGAEAAYIHSASPFADGRFARDEWSERGLIALNDVVPEPTCGHVAVNWSGAVGDRSLLFIEEYLTPEMFRCLQREYPAPRWLLEGFYDDQDVDQMIADGLGFDV